MSTKHKIAFVIQGLGVGGAEKFLISIVNHFYKQDIIPILIILSNKKELIYELNPNITVISILKKHRFDIFVSLRIKKFIKSNSIKTVFCINSYAFFLSKWPFYFDNSVSFFASLHSTIPFSVKYFWQNLLYFRVLKKKDSIIYLCKNQRNYLKRKYFLSKSFEHIIYNGIDTNYFNPYDFNYTDRSFLRTKLLIQDHERIIILVGRLQNEKRHIDAINALYYLHHSLLNKAHLLFVGSGTKEYSNILINEVIEKKLEGFVHFLGNHLDVRKFYSIADVFTLTSNSETFSLAALEAMSFGIPCSLTNVGGASEMIIDGLNGLLSNKEDIISIANTWNDLLNVNINKSTIRQHVLDNFSSDKMFYQYEKLLNISN